MDLYNAKAIHQMEDTDLNETLLNGRLNFTYIYRDGPLHLFLGLELCGYDLRKYDNKQKEERINIFRWYSIRGFLIKKVKNK